MKRTRLKHIFQIVAATYLLSVVSVSQATIVTTVTGTFSNMAGDEATDALYFSGEGTNHVYWGSAPATPVGFYHQSSLEFAGNNTYDQTLPTADGRFNLGKLTLHNGVTVYGTEAKSMTLTFSITQTDTTSPLYPGYSYTNGDSGTADINTTLNITGDAHRDADQVCFDIGSIVNNELPPPCAWADENSENFIVEVIGQLGSIHVIDLIPATTTGYVSVLDEFGHGYTRRMDASGTIITTYVPEPHTVLLMLSGVSILALTRLKKNRTS